MTKGIRSIKRGLAVLLSVCMVLGMVPVQTRAEGADVTVSANEVEPEAADSGSEMEIMTADSGSDAQTEGSTSGNESSDVYNLTKGEDGAYYDEQHVKYTLQADDGTATVAGYDTSYVNDTNFPADKVEAGEGWEITIPAKVSFEGTEYGVTKVTSSAFKDCIQLTKVGFPDDSVLTTLDMWSFRNCSLKSVRLPDSLTTMRDTVFRENTKLEYIYIPKNVKTIGNGICYGCTALTRIEVSTENSTFYTKSDASNCIIQGYQVIQGCSTSVLPKDVDYLTINYYAFAGIDATNIDFSNVTSIDNFAFIDAELSEDWIHLNSNCSIKQLAFYGCSTLKKAIIPENTYIKRSSYAYADDSKNITGTPAYGSSIFSKCDNLEKVVIPKSLSFESGFTDKITNYDFFRGCNSDNLIAYVEDGVNDYLMTALKNYAKEDWTGGKTTPTTNENGHFILKDAYRVQLAEEYEGYTLAKTKDCATLVPIPGDSATFTITADEGYKTKPVVKVGEPGLTSEQIAALSPVSYDETKGGYTITVDKGNYVVYLENYGKCGHSDKFTYTLQNDESGNSILTKLCDECGNVETGTVTAAWRHGIRQADSIAFSCDNINMKGTFAVSEDVVDSKDTYSYKFTPTDGSCTGTGSVTVTNPTEENFGHTTNGITYSTVKSDDDINTPLGNCSADIYYDSEQSILHINGSETYVVSGTTKKDRIVVNNTKPTILVLNGLDIQMTSLPAIELKGTADVKIVLAENTENTLKSTGNYAALQKNNLSLNTPKLAIYGPGRLTANASYGAAIGAEKNEYASNISFNNAYVVANSSYGSGIGNGDGASYDLKNASVTDYIINGGSIEASSRGSSYGISGGITVDEGAVVSDFVMQERRSIEVFKQATKLIDGFVSRYDADNDVYTELIGNVTIDVMFRADGLTIPMGSLLTIENNHGQMILETGNTITNNGTIILKGPTTDVKGNIDNAGTIYVYSDFGSSLKDQVTNTGSGTLHEDIDHDGLCDICSDHEDIGNVTVSYDKDVNVMQYDILTLSADVTPKDGVDKEITYQWYESDAGGNYTKIKDATTREYVQENCSLDVGTYTYRLQVLCDGIVRYIPFTVTVKESLSSLIRKARSILNNEGNQYSQVTLDGLNAAFATVKSLSESSTQEEKWNAYNELEAALNAMKNAHTIVKISSNPANSGILDGGGKYELGDQIILKAQAVDGFVFVGWYDTEQITESDQPLSTETTYNYGTVDEQTPSEISLYAVYKSNENRQLSITAGNGKVEYSYQNGTQTGTWNNSFTNNEFARGTYFTLTAKPSDGYTFLYWINQDGRVLSDSPTYSFYLGDNMELQACYKTTESSEAESRYVIFKDMSGKILWFGDVSMNQEADGTKYGLVKTPEHGIFTGYTFKQWKDASGNVMTVDDDGNIKITEAVTIYAEYEAETGLTLTVDGVQSDKTYSYGSLVTVTADESKDNKYFSGWYIGDKLVSDKKAYSFYITGNTEITAKYEGEEVITQKPLVNMTMSDRITLTDGKQNVVMNVNWSVPDGYEFIEAGLVRTLEDGYSEQLELDKVDKTNVKKDSTKLTTPGGTMADTLTLGPVSAKKNLYARGYLIYRDVVSGEVKTVYTDTFTSSAGNE